MESKPVRLGDLLTQAGVLRKEDLREAVQIANETGQLIGKVLVMSSYLTKHALQVSLEAQSLIRDSLVDADLAIKAIGLAAEEYTSLEAALIKLGWTRQQGASSAKLGELLLGSGVIAQAQLDSALSLSQQSGQPLGGILIKSKAIDETLLLFALDQQEAVRERKFSREEAMRLIAIHASESLSLT